MLSIYYIKEGIAFSDFELDYTIEGIALYDQERNYRIHTSTENIILAIRVAIYKGKIDPNNVRFYLEGADKEPLIMDKTGRPTNGCLPETYLDRYLNTLIGL